MPPSPVHPVRMTVLSALYTARIPARAFCALGVFWGSFAALVPRLKGDLGVSDAAFGLILLGSACGLVMALWLAPRVDARLGPRGLPIVTAALACVLLLPGVVQGPALFFAMMIALGGVSGLLDVLMNARVSELEQASARSLMNASHGAFSLAYAVAALLTGLGREAGFAPLTLLGAGAAVILLLAPSLSIGPQAGKADPGGGAPSPAFWPVALCGAVVLVAFTTEATVEGWSALHVERTLGGGAAEGALGPAMLGLTMAVGRFSGQVVAERLREWQVMVAASLLACAGALVVAAAASPPVAYLGFAAVGLGISVIGPMGLALAGKLVPPHQRTAAIARVAAIGFCGFFMAPALMGLTSQAVGLSAAFAGVALLVLCAAPLAVLLGRLQHEKSLLL